LANAVHRGEIRAVTADRIRNHRSARLSEGLQRLTDRFAAASLQFGLNYFRDGKIPLRLQAPREPAAPAPAPAAPRPSR
jgi:hypothetical protein